MTDHDADDIGSGNFALMRSLIAEGKPDRALSRQALATFCRIARAQRPGASPFPIEMLDWIADAFERFLSGEAQDIAKTLGLKARGAPVDSRTERRNWAIAARVAALVEERHGGVLTDNREGKGILAEVAAEFRLGVDVVRDVWYQFEDREECVLSKSGEMTRKKVRAYPMQEAGRVMVRLSRLPEMREWEKALEQSRLGDATDSPKARD